MKFIYIYIYIYDIDSCYIFFKLLDLSRSNGQKIYSLINTNILIRISFIILYLWHFILIFKIKKLVYVLSALSSISLLHCPHDCRPWIFGFLAYTSFCREMLSLHIALSMNKISLSFVTRNKSRVTNLRQNGITT